MSPDIHRPTPEDKERIKFVPDKLKVSGDGVFATRQGEGPTAGKPAVFLRLHFCNLACGARGGWRCDTGYTWDIRRPEFWQEPENWSCEDAASKIVEAWESVFPNEQERRLVITGGEPLLQQRKIAGLLRKLSGWKIEIETNGTIMPIPDLHTCQFNCSPKLENSGNPPNRRYKPEVLREINSLKRSCFKFVVVDPRDLDEIGQIVKDCGLDSNKIFVMPEGHTKEDVDAHRQKIKDRVAAMGWRITLRNQLIWFGSERRT